MSPQGNITLDRLSEDCLVTDLKIHQYEGVLPKAVPFDFLTRGVSAVLCVAGGFFIVPELAGLPALAAAVFFTTAAVALALDGLLRHSGTPALSQWQRQQIAWERGRVAWERMLSLGMKKHLDSLGILLWGTPRSPRIESRLEELYNGTQKIAFSCNSLQIYICGRESHSYSYSWYEVGEMVRLLEAEPTKLPLHAVVPENLRDPEDAMRCVLALTLLGAL